MATAAPERRRPTVSFLPDAFERALAYGSLLLLAATAFALIRGRAHWAEMDAAIWTHLALVGVALALTPVLMLRRRGDRLHRWLGWVWAASMFATALVSFGIREITNGGGMSPIHILSALTAASAPLLVFTARSRQHAVHRRIARGLTAGGLLVAGVLTFPGGRQLGNWLFG